MSCFVEQCPSRYNKYKPKKPRKSENNPPKISMFQVLTEETLQTWREVVPGGHDLTLKSFICEKHFAPGDISRHHIERMKDGSLFRLLRGRPLLIEGAVPCIFPDAKEVMLLDEPQRDWIRRKRNRKSKQAYLKKDLAAAYYRDLGRDLGPVFEEVKDDGDESGTTATATATAATGMATPFKLTTESMAVDAPTPAAATNDSSVTLNAVMVMGEIAADGSVTISSTKDVDLNTFDLSTLGPSTVIELCQLSDLHTVEIEDALKYV